jgi:FMN phosphatase YigB (HAD superfamily)
MTDAFYTKVKNDSTAVLIITTNNLHAMPALRRLFFYLIENGVKAPVIIKRQFENMVSEGKSINILSNTGFIKGKSLRKLISYYELTEYFTFQIYSDEVGYSKPNNEIFQLVFDQVNKTKETQKKEILHIGDNIIADYNGAINFGFDAHLLKI